MEHHVTGIITFEHEITRPLGDRGNPAMFSFPVFHRIIRRVSLQRSFKYHMKSSCPNLQKKEESRIVRPGYLPLPQI
jgi:hypothetical protein